MNGLVLFCVLAFALFVQGSVLDNRLTYPEMVEKINTLNLGDKYNVYFACPNHKTTCPKIDNHSNTKGWQAKMYPQFEKLTIEEGKKWLGAKLDHKPMKNVVNKVASKIPASFDARTNWPGSIHPIRNQGACGSCWAFGASEALSDRFAIASGNKINVVLSAQELVDCDKHELGCGGGYPIRAWNFMKDVGLLTVECYGPYVAKNEQCKFTNSSITQCPSGVGVPRFYHAKTAYSIPARNVEAIQTEIMTHGPIEAAFSVYQDFFNYKKGVYSHVSGQLVGGHAIKMLGWGTENGIDYWLCANSWGSKWGDLGGFFKIRRGDDECGIEDGCCAGLPDLN